MNAQLVYERKNRGCYIETSKDTARLAKKLETLRCPAELWELSDKGLRIELIGGIEIAEAPDDRRIKWNWWYDKTAVGL